jgi:hypothetical protein
MIRLWGETESDSASWTDSTAETVGGSDRRAGVGNCVVCVVVYPVKDCTATIPPYCIEPSNS